MLKDIYQFLEEEELRGRTTVRAVVLPSAKDDLQILFNQAMKEAIAMALDRKVISSSIDGLKGLVGEFKKLVTSQMNGLQGTHVRRQTEVSRTMRKHPDLRFVAKNFDRHRYVYNPQDLKRVQTFLKDFKEFVKKVDSIVNELAEDDLLIAQQVRAVRSDLQATLQTVQKKYFDMEAELAERGETHEEIDKREWQQLLEKTQILKEELLAAFTFETKASLIYDFLNLDLWRERWRIYELWMLTHLIQLFQGLGFTADMHERVSNGLWNLKFTKDKKPVAMLRGQDVNLEVYYQLYSKDGEGGNMPDLAIKKENGNYLIVLDPKYGESYRREELEKVGLRYANSKKFLPQLTLIHNFYAMSSYTFEIIQDRPRCLLVSNLRPGSTATTAVDAEIVTLVPRDWLPAKMSVVLLVDISGSIQKVQERIVRSVEKEFQSLRSAVLPNAILMLFSDKVDKEILFSEVQSIRDALNVSGGGTDLAHGLEAAIEKMKEMVLPRTLLFFTDGQGDLDVASTSQKIRWTEVQLRIYEAVDSDKPTLLQELALESIGKYQRI